MAGRIATHYSSGSKFFHWLIAVIVILMLAFSFYLGDVPNGYKPFVYMIHKSLGLTILFLMMLRVGWILKKGRPPLPATVPIWQQIAARSVQYALYVFLFAMPLAGWIMSVAANKTPVYFGLFKLPLPITPNKPLAQLMNNAHEVIAWILIVLIAFHITGAIKHYFWDKDKVLQRMLPGHND